jgi:hypothetical protein
MSADGSRRLVRIVAVAASVTMAGSLLVLASVPAYADPVITDISQYALDVPSSVLAAADSGADISGVTDGQYGGMLANTAKFDSDWITTTLGQTMGGTDTATPPDVDTLTPTELTTLEAMEAEFAGAPAVGAAALSEAAAGVSVIAGGLVAVSAGAAVDRLVGVDVDGGLCKDPDGNASPAEAVNSGAARIVATLTQTNCAQWAMDTDFQTVMNEDAGTITTGGLSCYPDDASKCVQFIGGSAYGGNSYCAQLTGSAYVYFNVGTNGDPYTFEAGWNAGDGAGYPCDGAPTGTSVVDYLNEPVTSYCASVDLSCDGGTPQTLTTSQNNPAMHFACKMTMTDDTTVTQNSDTFYASDVTVAKPELPAIHTDEVPASVECDLIGGPNPVQVMAPTSTTPAFQDWVTNNPECLNGSCLVDLQFDGQSCFFQAINCDGWMTDTNQATDYTCKIGTHTVDISECYVYGTTFNADDRANGHAYADPATGDISEGQTSPSDTDVVATALLTKTWLSGGHYPSVDDADRPAVAAAVAAACVAEVDQQNSLLIVKVDPKELCPLTPIYSPGNDIRAATDHDISAIAVGQPWTLHYESRSQKIAGGLKPGWYAPAATNCAGTYHPKGDPQYSHCDEYPYFSTVENSRSASLLNIWHVDNETQGLQLGEFYSSTGCDLTASATASDANEFIVAPDPGPFPSVAICN